MTIEANLSRITELLEVLTEVVVEKLYDEKDERCEAGCLCKGEDNYGNNKYEGTAILGSISAQVFFDGEEARAIARVMNVYPKLFTSTADFIRHATLSYTDTAFGNASEDDSSGDEADIELVFDKVQKFLRGER